MLYEGQAKQIAKRLAQHTQSEQLLTEARYFETNHERMQYRDFESAHLPIGSGIVESGAKQAKQRLCAPGMRWSRAGLENIACCTHERNLRPTVATHLPPSVNAPHTRRQLRQGELLWAEAVAVFWEYRLRLSVDNPCDLDVPTLTQFHCLCLSTSHDSQLCDVFN